MVYKQNTFHHSIIYFKLRLKRLVTVTSPQLSSQWNVSEKSAQYLDIFTPECGGFCL